MRRAIVGHFFGKKISWERSFGMG